MGCACSDVFCALGCVAGKSLDSVSSKVKSCAGGCASTDAAWEQYKGDFKKVYASDDEETERRALFEESLERIAKGNALGNNVFGLTWSSDRHPEEKHAKGLSRREGFKATAPLYEKKQERGC